MFALFLFCVPTLYIKYEHLSSLLQRVLQASQFATLCALVLLGAFIFFFLHWTDSVLPVTKHYKKQFCGPNDMYECYRRPGRYPYLCNISFEKPSYSSSAAHTMFSHLCIENGRSNYSLDIFSDIQPRSFTCQDKMAP